MLPAWVITRCSQIALPHHSSHTSLTTAPCFFSTMRPHPVVKAVIGELTTAIAGDHGGQTVAGVPLEGPIAVVQQVAVVVIGEFLRFPAAPQGDSWFTSSDEAVWRLAPRPLPSGCQPRRSHIHTFSGRRQPCPPAWR